MTTIHDALARACDALTVLDSDIATARTALDTAATQLAASVHEPGSWGEYAHRVALDALDTANRERDAARRDVETSEAFGERMMDERNQARRERDSAIWEMGEALKDRDTLAERLVVACDERDQAVKERDALVQAMDDMDQRDAAWKKDKEALARMTKERDIEIEQRDDARNAAAELRASFERERNAAYSAIRERDDAIRERAAVQQELLGLRDKLRALVAEN
jgi:chromosome segregation ATPase